jgi:orotate phosphoribosyltransferase
LAEKNNFMNFQTEVAKALIKIGGVGFKTKEPVTFKSGIKSPVYVDNRRFPFWPEEWHKIISGFKSLIEQDKIDLEVIAGVEAAGIPHSAALGFFYRSLQYSSERKPRIMA